MKKTIRNVTYLLLPGEYIIKLQPAQKKPIDINFDRLFRNIIIKKPWDG